MQRKQHGGHSQTALVQPLIFSVPTVKTAEDRQGARWDESTVKIRISPRRRGPRFTAVLRVAWHVMPGEA